MLKNELFLNNNFKTYTIYMNMNKHQLIKQLSDLNEQVVLKHEEIRAEQDVDRKLELSFESDKIMLEIAQVKMAIAAIDHEEIANLEKQVAAGKY